jgi:hypothetical protein
VEDDDLARSGAGTMVDIVAVVEGKARVAGGTMGSGRLLVWSSDETLLHTPTPLLGGGRGR